MRDFNKISNLELALAYLQLHNENLGLHPDNWQDPESGYCGWHVLLMAQAETRLTLAPDEFVYPTYIVPMPAVLGKLSDFHADEPETHDMILALDSILSNGLSRDNLAAAKNYVDTLCTVHSDGPEELEPLFDLQEVLHYLHALCQDQP